MIFLGGSTGLLCYLMMLLSPALALGMVGVSEGASGERLHGDAGGDATAMKHDTEWVKQAHSHPSHVVHRCQGSDVADGPCLGLVGIQSHPASIERRIHIRQTWLQHRVPGVEFVFVLGIPGLHDAPHMQRGSGDSLRQEVAAHHDMLILNISEPGSPGSAMKTFAFFQWTAMLGRGRYVFIAKTDDDVIINPYKMRLAMALLPDRRHTGTGPRQRIFWGRPLMQRGWPTRVHLGALHMLSYDMVEGFQGHSPQEFAQASSMRHELFAEDLRLASFINTHVLPSHEWLDALPCEVYAAPLGARTQLQYPFSNQTIVCRQLEEEVSFMAAYAQLLPYLEAMQQDCAAWPHQVITDRSGVHQMARPAMACQRWYHPGACLTPALEFVPLAQDTSIHMNVLLPLLAMLLFSGGIIALGCVCERQRGSRRKAD